MVPCTLFRNGYRVTTTALANSRANAFALLDTKCANKIAKFLNTPMETLDRLILLKGYDCNGMEPRCISKQFE